MRCLFLFIFIGLFSCSKPNEVKKEIFIVDSKELDDNCTPNTKVLTLNFSADLIKRHNSTIWTSFSEFSLENGNTLTCDFFHNELKDEEIGFSIYQESFDDTLFINKDTLGGRSKDDWYYSFDIEYGRVFLKFNFSNQNSDAKNKKLFEFYIKNIGVTDFQQNDFYQFEKLDSPILLSQGVVNSKISGISTKDNKKRYFLQTDLFESEPDCRDFYLLRFQILRPVIDLFELGDEILISQTDSFPISGKLKKDAIFMHLLFIKRFGFEFEFDGSWCGNAKPFLIERIFTKSERRKSHSF